MAAPAAGSAASPLRDRVAAYVTTASNAATITLGAAVPKYRLPLAADSGATVPFVIEDGTAWEKGTCVLTLSGVTWTAALTIGESYNADGSVNGGLLTLSGSAQFFIDARGVDIAYANDLANEIASRSATDLQVAFIQFSAAYTTSTGTLSGVVDDYQDSSGIDSANSSGLTISAGDVYNGTVSPAGLIANNMTSDSAPAPQVASASAEGSGAAFQAFDGSTSTNFSTGRASVAGDYLRRKLATATVVNRADLDFSGASASASQLPQSWQVRGSNDQSNWTVLTSGSGSALSPTASTTFNFSNTVAYIYYDFYVVTPGSSAYFFMSEFRLYAAATTTINSATLRRKPLTFTTARKRAYVYHLADLASGVQINTDLVGSVGDGTNFVQGSYQVVGSVGTHAALALYGADGNLGVDVSALATTKLVTKDVMTATGRIDVRETVVKGA